MNSLLLLGFPCSGKTSVGERAAHLLQYPFIDTDREIEKKFYQETGQFLDCHSLVKSYGRVFFQELETRVVATLSSCRRSLIALGGSTILTKANQHHLASMGHLIYLKASVATLIERNLKRVPCPSYADPQDPRGSLKMLYLDRETHYEQIAQTTIDTQGMSITEIADEVVKISMAIEVLHGK